MRAKASIVLFGVVGAGLLLTPSRALSQGDSAAVEERMLAMSDLALSHTRRGDYRAAVCAYEIALRMQPESTHLARSRSRRWVQNNLAWLLATAPDSTVRDGPRALVLAEQVVKSTPGNAAYLDTFAAAYAEVGRFDDAVRTQREAVARVGRGLRNEYRLRLTTYEAGKPWRDHPGIDAGTASPDDELDARYASPPKTLPAPGASSGLLLVNIDMRFPMGGAGLVGAALVATESPSSLIRVKSLTRHTVLFPDLPAGTYALRFVVAETMSKLVFQMPADSEFVVSVSPGGISYLGTVTVQKKIGFGPPQIRIGRDVERERDSWTEFLKKFSATPWGDLARARLDSLAVK